MNYTDILYELHTHLQKCSHKHSSQSSTAPFKSSGGLSSQRISWCVLAGNQSGCVFLQAIWQPHHARTHQQTMDDVCITARGPQEVNKLQESMAAFSLLTQLLQLHSSARLKLIYGSLHTTLCYFRERGFLHWELLPVFFHISFTLLR